MRHLDFLYDIWYKPYLPDPAFTWGVFYRLVAAAILLTLGLFVGMTPLTSIMLATITVGAVVLGDLFKEAPASSARQ